MPQKEGMKLRINKCGENAEILKTKNKKHIGRGIIKLGYITTSLTSIL
jgi:hypothetical protein